MPKTFATEPAVVIGVIGALVVAVLGLLVAFGVDISEEQQTAILAVVAALAPIVTAILIRFKVTPTNFVTPGANDLAGAIGEESHAFEVSEPVQGAGESNVAAPPVFPTEQGIDEPVVLAYPTDAGDKPESSPVTPYPEDEVT